MRLSTNYSLVLWDFRNISLPTHYQLPRLILKVTHYQLRIFIVLIHYQLTTNYYDLDMFDYQLTTHYLHFLDNHYQLNTIFGS